jgi:glycosyltransferase involved in cell wall biosynthesis
MMRMATENTNDRAASRRKPTVAHIMPWAGIGGVEIATLRLTEATSGHVRNVAFCLPDAVSLKNSFEKQGVETVTYLPPEPSLRHLPRYYKESAAVAQHLRAAGVDIVHFSDEKAAYHTGLASVLARTRRICHMRVSYPSLDLRRRICLLAVQSYIFVSKEALQTFAISLPANKARVIYDSVEVPPQSDAASSAEVRRELGIPEGCVVVGTIARVSRQKDYFTLAAAAVDVLQKHPETRFLIVGDNSLVALNREHYQEVLQRLTELGIADKFIFTGHRDDTPRLIAAMDFCVLSTHREGFPLSIVESMALGKPVIATAVGGIPEIVKPGVTGYLHQHGNSKELADRILCLIEDPARTSEMGNAARELVRRDYSRAQYVDEILKSYSDIMPR